MSQNGSVSIDHHGNWAELCFSHPKGNSLPGALLDELADAFRGVAGRSDLRAILLRSGGDRAFCAGASFDELCRVKTESQGTKFFSGFAKVILAMRDTPQCIVTEVQGKVVGGGVGLIASSDYVYAHSSASLRLSELALGIGPFVVGPAIERKVGTALFQQMALDAEWYTADWGKQSGLYAGVFDSHEELHQKSRSLVGRFSEYDLGALSSLKRVFWEGTDNWEQLLMDRAAISGRLVRGPFAQSAIAAVQAQDSGKRK